MGAWELGLRVMLAGVFLVALGKLRSGAERAAFADQVRTLSRLPAGPARILAVAVAGAELVTLVLLAGPRGTTAGFALAAILFGGFLAGTAAEVRRGGTAACRCFGFGAAPIGPAHLWRNGVLLAAALTGLLLPPAAVDGAGLTVAVVGGLAGAVLTVLFTEFATFFSTAAKASHPGGIR